MCESEFEPVVLVLELRRVQIAGIAAAKSDGLAVAQLVTLQLVAGALVDRVAALVGQQRLVVLAQTY